MRRRAFPLALAFCACAIPALALTPATPLSRYVRTVWTEQDGLVSSLIWAISQDRDGYLWLGTDAGLIRFDGVRFVHIDEPPLRTARIGALLSTSDGSLWIGSNSTAVLSRFQNGRFTSYSVDDGLPFGVTALLEDRAGILWAGGRGGLSALIDGRWERIGADRGLEADNVTAIFEDRHRVLWVATLRGLYKRSAGQEKFELSSSAFQVRSLVDDKSGSLWAVGPQQAIGTPLETGRSALGPWKDINGWRVIRDRDDSLWVATLGRGVLRRAGGASNDPTIEQLGSDSGLSHDVVRSLFEDREGNLWVGTQHGLNRFSDGAVTMLTSSADVSQPVRAVTSGADGSVWVGTDNGVYRFTGTTKTHFDRSDGLPGLVIAALYTDHKGTVWVAAEHGGIAKFENGRFSAINHRSLAALSRVWAMTADDDGGLWLCDVDSGVFRWKEGTLTSFASDPDLGPRRACAAALTDRAGRVWIAFSDGSVVVNDRGRLRVYGQPDGLPGGAVGALHEDSKGTIWVGTANGLATFRDGRFATVESSSGSLHTNVRAIAEGSDQTIWIGTRAGLVRLDDTAGRGPTFDLFDGLRGVPMSVGGYPSAARGGDGRLWFVTSSGLAVLDPTTSNKRRLPPPVRIEGVFADGNSFDLGGAPVELPPRTSRIQFDYTGLSFTAPTKVHFRFMLEGFDADWIDAGARRQAFYTNLPPRGYRFRVIADNDGVWNETGAAVNFTIAPTFFQTPAFYATVVIACGLLMVGAWQLRARRVHRQFALVLAERVRVAREIHDTLLQSLVGVAFQFDVASSELDESVPAGKARLARLRSQIEQAIKEARQSIWDLRSPTLERRELPAALRELGESITGKSVRFDLAVSGAPRHDMPRLDEALLRIGREAISNSVRHASATEVHVQIVYERDAVTLRVTDNGRGFESVAPQVADHWGLATMRERAEQLGGRLTLASSPGHGTEIEIIAPFARAQKA